MYASFNTSGEGNSWALDYIRMNHQARHNYYCLNTNTKIMYLKQTSNQKLLSETWWNVFWCQITAILRWMKYRRIQNHRFLKKVENKCIRIRLLYSFRPTKYVVINALANSSRRQCVPKLTQAIEKELLTKRVTPDGATFYMTILSSNISSEHVDIMPRIANPRYGIMLRNVFLMALFLDLISNFL